ncbi:MAG: alpha/beta hydrolase [Acidimicrobiales bacterium]
MAPHASGPPASRGGLRRRRPTIGLATALALALLAAACSTPTAGPPTATTRAASSPPGTSKPTSGATTTTTVVEPPVNKLAWAACDGSFECASLVVPISYEHPSEGTIKVAVVELPSAGDPKTARDLVLNPGGPGVSGVNFLEQSWTAFPLALRQKFNLVSFDPRGVGSSEPVTCGTPASLRQWLAYDPVPTTPRQIDALTTEDKAFDAACAKSVPRDVLANLSTEVTAHDLDRLRQALGEPKLDYLGFSYGTYLGALYAMTFPGNVGTMVLDGAVDPSLGMAGLGSQQAASFEVDLHDFFSWCSASATCTAELPDPPGDFADLVKDSEQSGKITADLSSALGGPTDLDFAIAETAVVSALYSTNTWPDLGEDISQALQGNGTALAELALEYAGFNSNGGVSNEIAAQMAIYCLDRPPPPVSSYPALATQFAKSSSDFGASEAWSTLPCNYWPMPATGQPQTLHLPYAEHILVVGSTHDPATPYAWAKALTEQLDGAILLTRTGDGHTGYFSSTCVQGWVDSYLESLRAPPTGTVCASGG